MSPSSCQVVRANQEAGMSPSLFSMEASPAWTEPPGRQGGAQSGLVGSLAAVPAGQGTEGGVGGSPKPQGGAPGKVPSGKGAGAGQSAVPPARVRPVRQKWWAVRHPVPVSCPTCRPCGPKARPR